MSKQQKSNNRRPYNGRNNNKKVITTKNDTESRKGYSSEKGEYCDDKSNDVSWYAHNPQLLKDAASVNFSTRTGSPLPLVSPIATGIAALQDVSCMPGIMTIRYNPSLGRTMVAGATDAVNTAAQNIYAFVRKANSGSVNYDASDLMMGLLAGSDAFAAIALGIRAYGIARVYDQKNMYTPKAMLEAMGFDANSIINDLATFRYRLNNAIAKASVIWVPNTMSITSRRYWMNSNIYKDSESVRAQFYMYVPNAFWKFDPTTETTGSSLQVYGWGSNITAANYFTMLDTLLDPIITDEDMGTMFGDLLKAYGKEKLYSLNMINEDYMVIPVYNKEVISQIHNCTTCPAPAVKVTQDATGVISEAPLTIAPARYGFLSANVLDFDNMVPEPEDIMVATRMMNHYILTGPISPSTDYNVSLLTCGTERAYTFKVYYYKEDGSLGNDTWYSYTSSNINAASIEAYGRFSRFDKHPILYWGTITGSGSSAVWTLDTILGDLDVCTPIDASTLEKMHSTAILSEYDIPLTL